MLLVLALLATTQPTRYDFPASDQLITNEYAFWNPNDKSAHRSPLWQMDSGSLFAKDGCGYSGVPDRKAPDVHSAKSTNSAIFRLVTTQGGLSDVAVEFDLNQLRLIDDHKTDWDGIHVWLRYQTEYELYYVSVNRRDNTLAIKRKAPGGTANGGTYTQIAEAKYTVPYNDWQHVRVTVTTNPDGSATFTGALNGKELVRATDPHPLGPGKVGIRGDNSEFLFKNFTVTPLP